jgi:hypothetical protein
MLLLIVGGTELTTGALLLDEEGDEDEDVVSDEPVPWLYDTVEMDDEPVDDADEEHVLDTDELDEGNFSLWSLVIILTFLSSNYVFDLKWNLQNVFNLGLIL